MSCGLCMPLLAGRVFWRRECPIMQKSRLRSCMKARDPVSCRLCRRFHVLGARGGRLWCGGRPQSPTPHGRALCSRPARQPLLRHPALRPGASQLPPRLLLHLAPISSRISLRPAGRMSSLCNPCPELLPDHPGCVCQSALHQQCCWSALNSTRMYLHRRTAWLDSSKGAT